MKKILLHLLLLTGLHAYSQDLRGGEITFANVSGETYQIFVTVYSEISTAVPRKNFFLNYGDSNDSIGIPTPQIAGNNIYKYSFFVYHTYPGPGVYLINLQADFLADSITNLPNSIARPLNLEAELTISSFTGSDHSPFFIEAPESYFPCCTKIIDNPGAYDADGDSLSYSLLAVDSGYSFAGATIDSISGDLTFTPPQAGRYLFDIKVSEWRTVNSISVFIGYVVRQVLWDISDAAGIEEMDNNEVADVFPTVVRDEVTVKMKKSLSNVQLSVTDMQGRTVCNGKTFLPSREETLHLRSLSAGAYMIVLKSDENIFIKKILKM